MKIVKFNKEDYICNCNPVVNVWTNGDIISLFLDGAIALNNTIDEYTQVSSLTRDYPEISGVVQEWEDIISSYYEVQEDFNNSYGCECSTYHYIPKKDIEKAIRTNSDEKKALYEVIDTLQDIEDITLRYRDIKLGGNNE